MPIPSIDVLITLAESTGMRLLAAQGLRLRGVLQGDPADLVRSLGIFDSIGAQRYAARLRIELGTMRGDADMRNAGMSELEGLGELEQLARSSSRGT